MKIGVSCSVAVAFSCCYIPREGCAALLLLVASVIFSQAAPPISLTALPQPDPPYGLGYSPYSVAVGDVNNDDIPDILTANNGSDSVSVLIGRGDGTFHQATHYSVGVLPYAVALTDFDEDGHLDFVSSSTTVWFGAGDGSFHSPTTNAIGKRFPDLAVTDLNNDGHQDFVAVESVADTVTAFFGDGAGGFPTNTSMPVPEVDCLAVADFTNDGHLDIITGNSSHNGSLALLPGDGNGGFGPIIHQTGLYLGRSLSMASGDLDGDNHPDLVCTASGFGEISVLRGNGDGTFAKLSREGARGARSTILSDLNGDAIPDIVAPTPIACVFTGLGEGEFERECYRLYWPPPSSDPRRGTAADLNGDGRADLVIGMWGSPATDIMVLLNTTRPELQMDIAGDPLQLSWPRWSFTLETRTDLGSHNDWEPVAVTPSVVEGRNVLTIPVDEPTRFYRLSED